MIIRLNGKHDHTGTRLRRVYQTIYSFRFKQCSGLARATSEGAFNTLAGATANTLIVRKPDGKTMSLRPFYNAIEGYCRRLDALVALVAAELERLRNRINRFVLDSLASQAFDPDSIDLEPPLFRLVLSGFSMSAQRGEPTDAAFQGIVFGFLRADNPHLQIEMDMVRTGSKRLQRVGDVDGWEGGRLAIPAEVKQYTLFVEDTQDFEAFRNATGRQGALDVVAALGFAENARSAIQDLGLIPLDRADMMRFVEIWDPLKQRTAVSSLLCYSKRVEKNSVLTRRIETFLSEAAGAWRSVKRETEARPETAAA